MDPLARTDWEYYVTRQFNWFVQATQMVASDASFQKRVLGFSVPTSDYLIVCGDEYAAAAEEDASAEIFRHLFEKDKRFFRKFEKKIFSIVKATRRYEKRLRKKSFARLKDEELAKELSRFFEIYATSFVPVWTRPDEFLESSVPEEILPEVATPLLYDHLAYMDEPVALMVLAKRVRERELDRHVAAYGWMKAPLAIEDAAWTREDYEKRMEHLKKKDLSLFIERAEGVARENDRRFKEAVRAKGVRGERLEICRALRAFIFLRTYTVEVSDHLFFVARHTLLQEIAQRLNLSSSEVVSLDPLQLILALRGEMIDLHGKAQDRMEGYAILWHEGQVETVFGSIAGEWQTQLRKRQRQSVSAGDSVSGSAASLGCVRGIARVLESPNDVDRVNEGDVLIAHMTTPDYIAAMERAAAFVTDEGGITCHAAILSREFGVPCVVGTKCATTFFKDGEIVEVDADHGIIRRVNKTTP